MDNQDRNSSATPMGVLGLWTVPHTTAPIVTCKKLILCATPLICHGATSEAQEWGLKHEKAARDTVLPW